MELTTEVKYQYKAINRQMALFCFVFKLQDAKMKYKDDLTEMRRKMYKMYKAHRKAIEKTKPYFIAKEIEEQVRIVILLNYSTLLQSL